MILQFEFSNITNTSLPQLYSDMTICVHDSKDLKDVLLEGHSAPVLSVAMDPKGRIYSADLKVLNFINIH